LSIHASAAKIQPDEVVRWCQNGDFFVSCIFRARGKYRKLPKASGKYRKLPRASV